jgi:site-specific DNA-methyltransferase (adenine-specific)
MSVVPETFLDGRVMLHAGDCLDVMASLSEDSVDAIVCDPPYHLTSIVRRFGAVGAAAAKDYTDTKDNATGAYVRASRGFMGKQWDGGDIAFRAETWAAVLRVLKPGGHLVAFSGTRTYHRMACAIEDAGFEIRDMIGWLYGSGFPKSHNIGKAVAAAAARGGCRPEDIRRLAMGSGYVPSGRGRVNYDHSGGSVMNGIVAQALDLDMEWSGWGTALKPAQEPICLARKPISESNIAANVLRWGTGAINVDVCRVHGADAQGGKYSVKRLKPGATLNKTGGNWRPEDGGAEFNGEMKPGRWPANIVHDGSDDVVAVFPDTVSGALSPEQQINGGFKGGVNCYGSAARGGTNEYPASRGSAARFFYTAKADALDRIGSKHPTVKPLDLMQWLVRLVTPPGGTVLDPFAGTGTTGEAAFQEGFSAILIEREGEYLADIRRRMALALSGAHQRARESAKARGDVADAGPLFGGSESGGGDRETNLRSVCR